MYREQDVDPIGLDRKRACSMITMDDAGPNRRTKSTASIPGSLGRRLSDSDLNRINREKTFGVQALVQPAELLARVVTALGNISTIEEDGQSILERASLTAGINCFSDSQILASERTWSGWSMVGSDKSSYLAPPPMGRPRASSDIGLHPHHASGVRLRLVSRIFQGLTCSLFCRIPTTGRGVAETTYKSKKCLRFVRRTKSPVTSYDGQLLPTASSSLDQTRASRLSQTIGNRRYPRRTEVFSRG